VVLEPVSAPGAERGAKSLRFGRRRYDRRVAWLNGGCVNYDLESERVALDWPLGHARRAYDSCLQAAVCRPSSFTGRRCYTVLHCVRRLKDELFDAMECVR